MASSKDASIGLTSSSATPCSSAGTFSTIALLISVVAFLCRPRLISITGLSRSLSNLGLAWMSADRDELTLPASVLVATATPSAPRKFERLALLRRLGALADELEDAGAGLGDGEGPDQVSLPGRHRLSEPEGLVVDGDERLLDGSLAEDHAGREGETGEESAELHVRLETGG